jgi:hypothetical protein
MNYKSEKLFTNYCILKKIILKEKNTIWLFIIVFCEKLSISLLWVLKIKNN